MILMLTIYLILISFMLGVAIWDTKRLAEQGKTELIPLTMFFIVMFIMFIVWLVWKPISNRTYSVARAMDSGSMNWDDEDIIFLIVGEQLPQSLIAELIKDGRYLSLLYTHQVLSPNNIDLAIDRGEYLDILFEYQAKHLTPQNIQHAIEHEVGDLVPSSLLYKSEQRRG